MSQTPSETVSRKYGPDDLKGIASHQKVVILCILIYLIAVAAQFLLPPDLRPILGLGVLAVGIVSAVFVFRLAIRLYGTGVGVMWGVLTLIPLIGLVSLLIVNGKATRILKENGVDVGFLGAQA